MNKLDLTDEIYGDWEVLYEAEQRGCNRVWFCRCKCGIEKEVYQNALRSGESSRCIECYNLLKQQGTYTSKYGIEHIFYKPAAAILDRCYNTKHSRFKDWGGRGIKVYNKWLNSPSKIVEYLDTLWFKQFGHKDFSLYGINANQYSIDRINNDKDYTPGNLRFATKSEQQLNNRRTI